MALHVDTLQDGDTEQSGDAEGNAAGAAAFAATSFAGAHAQVGSCTMANSAIPAGLCEITCVTMCCTLHLKEMPAFAS